MRKDTKLATFVGCGFLLVLFGSMPLNGYLGFFLSPSEFHQDVFIGTLPHLLLGLIPWFAGLFLIVVGAEKAWLILAIALAGSAVAFLMCLPATINAKDYKGLLGWLAIVACAVIVATTIRAIINLCKKTDASNALLRA